MSESRQDQGNGRTRQRLLGIGVAMIVVAIATFAFLLGLGVFRDSELAPVTLVPVSTQAPATPTSPPTFPPPTPSPVPTLSPTPSPTPSPIPELGTSNVYVEYILDASGSMTEKLPDGTLKLVVAKDVLREHMVSFAPETNIGLRAYGHRVHYQQRAKSCEDIELIAPVDKGQMEVIATWLQDFQAQGMTPLAESIRLAIKDFVFDPARLNSIVLISDGIETCGGDPCGLVEDLKAQGINFVVHVIGLHVDEATRQQLQCIARSGGGTYHGADSAKDLQAALGDIQDAVTEDQVIVPVGIDTPTPVPPPTDTPVPPTATNTPTPQEPTPTAAPPTATAKPTPQITGKIIFQHSGNQPGHQIWVMNADGSGKKQLTFGETWDTVPVWSPDGNRIAFERAGGSARPRVMIMNADGSGMRTLVDATCGFPDWSPRGDRIAVLHTEQMGHEEVAVVGVDGTGFTDLTNSPGWDDYPAWSPDGTQIAYSCAGNLCVMNADGSNRRQLVASSVSGEALVAPDWSPDGRNILFCSDRAGTRDIHIISIDGTGLRKLLSGDADEHMPAWSPDGSRIVFQSNRGGSTQIWVMSTDGGNLVQLTSDGSNYAPEWWAP